MTIPADVEYENKKKSKGIAYAMWFFLGVLGGHRFYVGDVGMGIAMLLTLGGLGVWALIDVFLIGARVEQLNRKIYAETHSTSHWREAVGVN